MAKEYVPIFFDWMQVTEELNDQEKGRLIDAIVLYAAGGDWQDRIKGNERYLFPAFREQINRSNQISEARSIAGSKPKQTETKSNKPEQTVTNGTKANEEEENNNNNKEKEKNNKKISPLAGFDRFWAAYPKKTAKPDAVKAFGKLKPDADLLDTILGAIERQKATAQWQEDGGRFIPHPATWLNGRRWEDEVQAAGNVRKAVTAQDYTQREYEDVSEKPEDMIRRLMSEGA